MLIIIIGYCCFARGIFHTAHLNFNCQITSPNCEFFVPLRIGFINAYLNHVEVFKNQYIAQYKAFIEHKQGKNKCFKSIFVITVNSIDDWHGQIKIQIFYGKNGLESMILM